MVLLYLLCHLLICYSHNNSLLHVHVCTIVHVHVCTCHICLSYCISYHNLRVYVNDIVSAIVTSSFSNALNVKCSNSFLTLLYYTDTHSTVLY